MKHFTQRTFGGLWQAFWRQKAGYLGRGFDACRGNCYNTCRAGGDGDGTTCASMDTPIGEREGPSFVPQGYVHPAEREEECENGIQTREEGSRRQELWLQLELQLLEGFCLDVESILEDDRSCDQQLVRLVALFRAYGSASHGVWSRALGVGLGSSGGVHSSGEDLGG